MFTQRWLAFASLTLAMALWGSSFIALKIAFVELPAMWVIFGRMAIGSLAFTSGQALLDWLKATNQAFNAAKVRQ